MLVALVGSLLISSSRFELAAPLTLPAITIDAINDGIGLAQQAARAQGLQGRVLWVDGTANLERCSSDDRIEKLVAQIKKVGFNTIVYDVKPISGQVLYPSQHAPKIEEWRGQKLPKEFDPLDSMSRHAKAQGIELLISLNAFSEGHAMFKVGPGYDKLAWQTVIYEPRLIVSEPNPVDPARRKWAELNPKLNTMPTAEQVASFTDSKLIQNPDPELFAVSLDRFQRVVDGFEFGGAGGGVPTVPTGGVVLVGRGRGATFLRDHANPGRKLAFETTPTFMPISGKPEQQFPLITNPNHPEVRAHGLAIVEEIMTRYPVNGIVYDDRLRYGGLNADFSPLTTSLFEKHVGKKLLWPDDVFRYTISPRLERGIRPGPFFDQWLAWRAQVMQEWVDLVGTKVRSLRSGAKFGVYAGSWYGDYQQYGNNWASPEFNAGFWFLNNAYRKTGFAPSLDVLMTGCYYTIPTIFDALQAGKPIGPTIEAAGMLSNRAARDTTWTYAGIMLSNFKGDPEGLGNALQAACASTQGVMVFDLSHDIEPMWPVFAQAFSRAARAPHQVPGLIDQIRAKRRSVDAFGGKEPPVPISAGSAGIGF